jgi:alkylation response protein AidB-like acyl-CoA dehydrogenase
MTLATDPATAAHEVTEAVIAPRAADVDSERRFPGEGLDALAKAGLAGLLVPQQFGGLGGSLSDLVRVLIEVGRGCGSTAMCYLMHCCGAAVIAAKATPQQGEAWLRPAASGEALATLAFSERGTGAHFYAPDLTIEQRNGTLSLNGRKSFITSGGQATLYPVLVKSPSGNGLDIFVLTRDMPGISFEGAWQGVGMAGNSSIAGSFQDVAVPEANRLGAAGDGLGLVFEVVGPTFLLGLAGVSVGIAQAALDASIEHAKTRTYSSGQSLAEIPAIQNYVAGMAIQTESARRLLLAAAAAADAGEATALALIFEAKIGATEAAQAVTQTAMQVGGGQAYSRSLSVERHWRDARAGSVMAPTNDVLMTWLGKALTGLPLF